MDVRDAFGNIDIYLFDQILKGRFSPGMKILDAGCGGGRNLVWFLRNGFDVYGVDQNESAIIDLRSFAKYISPESNGDNFRVSAVESMPFPENHFDLLISSAVLHFAESENHFDAMFREMWRVLKPNGILFARLASSIGIETLVEPRGNGRFQLPDGSERFLVSEEKLVELSGLIGAEWLEYLKTTNVQNLRCMSTIVWQKR